MIDNFQDYLKYLMITTTIEPKSMNNAAVRSACFLNVPNFNLQMKDYPLKMEEEEEMWGSHRVFNLNSAGISKFESGASDLASQRKRSQKLFTLMQKRYSLEKAPFVHEKQVSKTSDPSKQPVDTIARKMPIK